VFRRTGKAMGEVCQLWWRICWDINVFLPRSNITCFTFLYPFVTSLLTLPRINFQWMSVFIVQMQSFYSCLMPYVHSDICFGLMRPASGLTQHEQEEGHKICSKEEKVLQTEPETTYTSLIHHPISQPSLEIAPIWAPIIAAQIRKLQLRPM
jgi:hypothetical protein